MVKPVHFVCRAPHAKQVYLLGDFNEWDPSSHPMKRCPDGSWFIEVPMTHGHHLYVYLVDGHWTLDPQAQGIARNARNERVSMVAVS